MYHVAGRMHHSVVRRPPVSDRAEGFTRRARRGRARAHVQPAVLGPAQEAEDDEKDAVDLSWCKIDDAALDGLFEALKPSKIKQLWLNSARLLNPTCRRLRAHVRTRRSPSCACFLPSCGAGHARHTSAHLRAPDSYALPQMRQVVPQYTAREDWKLNARPMAPMR